MDALLGEHAPFALFCVCAGLAFSYVATRKRSSGKKQILLITDIGRDVDDTLAILALGGYALSSPDVEIAGVVATGGAGTTRARVVRFWLRRMGFPDTVQFIPPPTAARPPSAAAAATAHTSQCRLPPLRLAPTVAGRGVYARMATALLRARR